MAYTRVPLFLGLLFVFILISIEASARDIPESAEKNKIHIVQHIFGHHHHDRHHHGGPGGSPPPQESAHVDETKVHAVEHLFGRNRHRCRHHGVGCKGYNPPQGTDTTSEEVENKQEVDEQEQAVEDNKVHVVEHLFGRRHHRCKHHGGGPGCKQDSPQAGKEAANQEVENKGMVNTEDQKDVTHGGGNN